MANVVGHTDYEGLVSLLYEAALDDTIWPQVVRRLDATVDSIGSHLAIIGDVPVDPNMVFSHLYVEGAPAREIESEYNEVYLPMDERIPRIRQWPRGRLFHNTDVFTDAERKSSPVYAGFLNSMDGTNQVGISAGGLDTFACLVLTRTAAGDWQSDHLALLERLVPHLGRFYAVRRALARADALDMALTSLLASPRIGVVLLDAGGRIVETNAHAQRFLGEGGVLQDDGGFLSSRRAATRERLRAALARALPTTPAAPSASGFRLDRPGLPALVVHVVPLKAPKTESGLRHAAAMVLIADPSAPTRVDASFVAAALGLTRAESRVAALLAEGRTVQEIATLTHRAEDSVRWQLKRTFSKLGIGRQADLVRLVLSLPHA